MARLGPGSIRITPAATAALADADIAPAVLVSRHQRGDWGQVEARQRRVNEWTLQYGGIIRSRYRLATGLVLLVATATDRSYTRVMLETEFRREEVNAREGYAHWAVSYDQERNPLIAVEEPHVGAILADLDVASALDVATGTGRHALALARRGIAVTAVDPSPEMLAVAQRSADRERLAIDFCRRSLDGRLPFSGGQFDLAICSLALCHVPHLPHAAREFARVLRAGGQLLITDFHPDSVAFGWRTHTAQPDGIYMLPDMPHTRADYVSAVERAGFTLLDVRDIPIRDVPEGYLVRHDEIVRDYGHISLCLIVHARKQP
jgi:SAM-dependent methyltransferase